MVKLSTPRTWACLSIVIAAFCHRPLESKVNGVVVEKDKRAGVVRIKDPKGRTILSKKIKSAKKRPRKFLQAELAGKKNLSAAGSRLVVSTVLEEVMVWEEVVVQRGLGGSFALHTLRTFLAPSADLGGGYIGDNETFGFYREVEVYAPTGRIVQSFVTDDQVLHISDQGTIVIVSDEAEEASGGPNFSLISKGDIEKVTFSGPGDFSFSPNERFVLFVPFRGGDADLYDTISNSSATIPAGKIRGDFPAVPIFKVLDNGGVEMSLDGGTTMVKIRE